MTYSEAIDYLYNLRLFGAKFGLDNTRRLAELAGHPERSLRFLHVAGTNGKGSTCAMLESVYRAAGLRVGLFTSPHLVHFGERIQVDRHRVSEADIVRLTAECQDWIRHFPPHAHPTFFEVVTVMALRYFAQRQCDLVVWETGLGGRLDATNIVDPLASLITNVQLDHQQWLGQTVAQIAVEKAGIIKPGRPVLTTAQDPAVLAVIAQRARELGAPLHPVSPEALRRPPLDRLELSLRGDHQRLNAALALAAVETLQPQIPVSAAAVERGLATVDWPGRFQLETTASGQRLLLDGAHNPAGALTLRAALERYFPSARPALVLGILKDKDWHEICRILAPVAGRLLIVPVHSERTASPGELRDACHEANPVIDPIVYPSLSQALEACAREPLVVLAGSLYLVGEAMELLRLSSAAGGDERGLNEWTATPVPFNPRRTAQASEAGRVPALSSPA